MKLSIATPEACTDPDPLLAEAIAAVHNSGWRRAYGQLLPERFYDDAALAQRRRMWMRALARPEACARIRLALTSTSTPPVPEDVVGFAMAGPARDDDIDGSELYMIYVLADVYGTGAGQALLDAVLGDQPAMLWTAEDNARARAFYKRNGFDCDGHRQTDPALDGLAEVRMVRPAR